VAIGIGKLAAVETRKRYETKALRDRLGLKKSKQKLSDSFTAHCVDSWVLANASIGGHVKPDNMAVLYLIPLRFHRRQLHMLQPAKGGIRKPYGSTRSLSFKRGSWVKHPKHGVCYVGGTTADTISLHQMQDGLRIARIKPETVTFLCTAAWRTKKGERHSAIA